MSHIRLHGLILTLALVLLGCSGASPNVAVLGVARPAAPVAAKKRLVVYVEVHNSLGRHLEFSRLEYRLSAQPWFATDGNVEIKRAIGAGSSAVVEIEVPVEIDGDTAAADVAYTLDGRLYAQEDRIERSWKVRVHGLLQGGSSPDSADGASAEARTVRAVQVATAD